MFAHVRFRRAESRERGNKLRVHVWRCEWASFSCRRRPLRCVNSLYEGQWLQFQPVQRRWRRRELKQFRPTFHECNKYSRVSGGRRRSFIQSGALVQCAKVDWLCIDTNDRPRALTAFEVQISKRLDQRAISFAPLCRRTDGRGRGDRILRNVSERKHACMRARRRRTHYLFALWSPK